MIQVLLFVGAQYNEDADTCRILSARTTLNENRRAAVSAVIGAAFGAAGQRCMALSVAVLVGDAKLWAKDIAEGASELKVGFESR